MGLIEQRLNDFGITLPDPPLPAANYIPFKLCENLIFVAGQVPMIDGNFITGKVGENISIKKAKDASRICGISIISQLNKATGNNLDKIKSIVKLGGFVNCTPEFIDHPEVINGASDLMVDVFGDIGRHARYAVGSNSLPKGVCVEIDAIAEIN